MQELTLRPKKLSAIKETILVYSEQEIDNMRTSVLESLITYYEQIFENIGGEEIWQLMEHLARAEYVHAVRRRKENKLRLAKNKRKRKIA